MSKVDSYEFSRAMSSLASMIGIEWNSDSGRFQSDDHPYSYTPMGRIVTLENKYNNFQPCDTMEEEIYLLLEHLGLEIEDGKRIVKVNKTKKGKR